MKIFFFLPNTGFDKPNPKNKLVSFIILILFLLVHNKPTILETHDIKQTTKEIQKKPSFHQFDLLDEETSKKLKSNLFFKLKLIFIFDSY